MVRRARRDTTGPASLVDGLRGGAAAHEAVAGGASASRPAPGSIGHGSFLLVRRDPLEMLCLAAGGWYVGVYLVLAFARLRYPFELEWMEGGSLDEVRRILAGQPLYVRPSIEFVPFLYTPLYYWVAAAVARVTGTGLMPLRLVSVLSSFGCLALIFRQVLRETRSSFAAALAASLFAACFRIGGSWFDLARVDSLALFLLLGALYALRFHDTRWGWSAAGLLVGLSFLTKQSGLLVALPLFAYAGMAGRRRSFYFLGAAAAVIVGSGLALDAVSGGWFRFYVFDLPSQHPLKEDWTTLFWSREVMAPLGIACVLSLFHLFFSAADAGRSRHFLFYSLASAGLLGGSWATRVHEGSYFNALMPAYALIALCFGLAVPSFLAFVQAGPAPRRRILTAFLHMLVLVQFAMLAYVPSSQLPNEADRRAGERIVRTLSEVRGEVLVLYHPYLAAMAGKAGSAHYMAISDVLRGGEGPVRSALSQELDRAFDSARWSLVVIDERICPFRPAIERRYRLASNLTNESSFWSLTGMRTKPKLFYVRREPGGPPVETGTGGEPTEPDR